ncbi:hypothetical protein T439DRAFT_97602 [Meredithblackwellia eburnea MCA 4105]
MPYYPDHYPRSSASPDRRFAPFPTSSTPTPSSQRRPSVSYISNNPFALPPASIPRVSTTPGPVPFNVPPPSPSSIPSSASVLHHHQQPRPTHRPSLSDPTAGLTRNGSYQFPPPPPRPTSNSAPGAPFGVAAGATIHPRPETPRGLQRTYKPTTVASNTPLYGDPFANLGPPMANDPSSILPYSGRIRASSISGPGIDPNLLRTGIRQQQRLPPRDFIPPSRSRMTPPPGLRTSRPPSPGPPREAPRVSPPSQRASTPTLNSSRTPLFPPRASGASNSSSAPPQSFSPTMPPPPVPQSTGTPMRRHSSIIVPSALAPNPNSRSARKKAAEIPVVTHKKAQCNGCSDLIWIELSKAHGM